MATPANAAFIERKFQRRKMDLFCFPVCVSIEMRKTYFSQFFMNMTDSFDK